MNKRAKRTLSEPRPLGELLHTVAQNKLLSVLEGEEEEELLGRVETETGLLFLGDPLDVEDGIDVDALDARLGEKEVVSRRGAFAFSVEPGAHEVFGIFDEDGRLCEIRIVLGEEEDEEDDGVIDAEWTEIRR